MREGFEAKPWSEAWERDLDSPADATDELGIKKLFSALVPDRGIKVCSTVIADHLLICYSSLPLCRRS